MTGCEWNPEAKRPTWVEETSHALADWHVGHGADGYFLCAKCAALPEFKRYQKRAPLKSIPGGG